MRGVFTFWQTTKNGVPQAVFTFLLVPCCLTMDFRASPLIANMSFLWAWNAPTDRCAGRFDMPPDLSLFPLVGDPQKGATGNFITLFYADRLGYYPHIDERTGRSVHGGIPQMGSLKKHLDKAKEDISYYMPIDNVGLAVIDWENWRPTWARNWKPKDTYRDQSIELVLQQNIQLTFPEAAKIAKVEFEKAAKSFMQETLKLGKLLRPNHLWGYYLFPDCYNHNYNQPSYNGSCRDIEKRRNDALDWLWKESTALFPSIYLNSRLKSSPQAALFVRNRVQEAIRMSKVASDKSPLPVFVYARPVFTDVSLQFLSQGDLVNTIGESVALGASGIIMWGSLNLSLTRTTLNPYVINVTLATKMCSQALCQEQGVCTRKYWNSSNYLHLNPKNFPSSTTPKGAVIVLTGKTLPVSYIFKTRKMKQPIKVQIQCLVSFLSTFFVFLYFLHFIFKLINIFWLCWVFVAAHGLSLVAESGGYPSLRYAGFSLRWLLLLQSTGSRRTGFSSCGTWAQ
uniref:Hyaluronidase n=1 Tax=Monodon monoceros TaxID=40151 RepID=A0A8C6BCQ0_MONMO